MRSLSILAHRQFPASRFSRSASESLVKVAVGAASVVLLAYAAFALLEYASAHSTAYAIAGLAIVVLALPFLVLSGMLLQAFLNWMGMDLRALTDKHG